jgi:hypothetical protein
MLIHPIGTLEKHVNPNLICEIDRRRTCTKVTLRICKSLPMQHFLLFTLLQLALFNVQAFPGNKIGKQSKMNLPPHNPSLIFDPEPSASDTQSSSSFSSSSSSFSSSECDSVNNPSGCWNGVKQKISGKKKKNNQNQRRRSPSKKRN